jgi:hypothetical protein
MDAFKKMNFFNGGTLALLPLVVPRHSHAVLSCCIDVLIRKRVPNRILRIGKLRFALERPLERHAPGGRASKTVVTTYRADTAQKPSWLVCSASLPPQSRHFDGFSIAQRAVTGQLSICFSTGQKLYHSSPTRTGRVCKESARQARRQTFARPTTATRTDWR